jgi:hypothetical protein
VLKDFELSPAELEVLRCALVSLDRADQAATVLDAEGVTVVDRYGSPKAHPAVDVEARNRAAFARMVAQLGVKVPEVPPVRSPRSVRASAAAQARWARERARQAG